MILFEFYPCIFYSSLNDLPHLLAHLFSDEAHLGGVRHIDIVFISLSFLLVLVVLFFVSHLYLWVVNVVERVFAPVDLDELGKLVVSVSEDLV